MGNLFSDTKKKKERLNLLLMGKTGHGKSSLGNCILGCETFEVCSDTNSQTGDVECAYSEFESFVLKVVDGPGLQDTKLSQRDATERAIHNMSKALTMCCEGVDAFLFVFRFGVKFTSEEVSVLKTLQEIFGKDFFKHAVVVLTHGDLFYLDKKTVKCTFDDWCKNQTGPFRELYDACDGRCVLFNNNESNKKKQKAQREQLTQLTHHLKSRHGRYTAACFKLAAEERQRMIIKLKQSILKENIQKRAGILFSKIEKHYQQPSAEQRAEIEGAIGELKNKITEEDVGPGLLKDLMKIVEEIERNLHDVDELHRLAKKLEKIRKAAKIYNAVSLLCCAVGGVLTLVISEAKAKDVLGCGTAIGAIGSELINHMEHTTKNEMKAVHSNMSITVPHPVPHKK